MHDHEVIGYFCEGEYNCIRHSPEPTREELDVSHVSAVFAGDEGADDYHCSQCYAEEHPAPTYLDTSRITAVKETCVPCSGITRTGYGPKLASPWMLQLDGKRWHRVYTMCWSNCGTDYVRMGSKPHLLITGELTRIINRHGESQRKPGSVTIVEEEPPVGPARVGAWLDGLNRAIDKTAK